MEEKNTILQGLPLITIILALLFFIVVRVISRFKKRALGDSGSKGPPNLPFEARTKFEHPGRVQLRCPALIDRSKGVMKVGIKELATNGAFITCPHPFPIGDCFAIKILLNGRDAQTFHAEVVWNNQNVIEEEIVVRGMKVRFLHLSQSDRMILDELISLHLQSKAFF